MNSPIGITDPDWRRAVDQALARSGELLALVTYAGAGGATDWFLIHDQDDLEHVFAHVGTHLPEAASHLVNIVATPQLPQRGNEDDSLQAEARRIAASSWVVMACRRDGDPKLYDVDAVDNVAEVDEWFREPHVGERVVGEDPYVKERTIYPEGDEEFVAFGVRPDGTVLPGSY